MTPLPYESFSPTLLRSDPAALAAWIRHRFVRWLTGVALTKTKWTYTTTKELLVPVGTRGADVQKLALSDGADSMDFQYRFAGPAVPIGAPLLQTDNRGFQEQKTGRSIWTPSNVEADGHSGNLKTLAGMQRAVLIDLYALFGRRTEGGAACGAMLLFGVDMHCATWIRRVGFHSHRLLEQVATGRKPDGRFSMDDIREDVDGGYREVGFQAALFFDGVDVGTSPLVAYFVEIPNATAESHTGDGKAADGN